MVELDRVLRVDAERNRDRIVEAARTLYATQGLEISMAAVAREAGVGKATLARRFTSKEELIAAVFAEHMADYVKVTSQALADPDPWAGFTGLIEAICGMQAADRGFADVLTISFPDAAELETLRGRAYRGFVELIDRAKRTGHLRADFVSEDLVVLMMANAGVVAATGDKAEGGWRRLVGQMLRAYASPGAPLAPLPAAPSSKELNDAMTRLSARSR